MSRLFKLNDLKLTEHLIEIRKALSSASGSFRAGYLNDMISDLADIEHHARLAGWRALELRKDHGKGQLPTEPVVGEVQQE